MARSRWREKRVSLAAPAFLVFVLLLTWGWIGNVLMLRYESDAPSDARGSRVNGYLVNGKRLPIQGANFETYSRVLSSYGRTCVHHQVRQAMLDSYATAFEEAPQYLFTYGETAWCGGGAFWPHRTHQNGLSVDFMVPVKRNERVVSTPATIFDGFGYSNEFDEDGTMGEYRIDFEALALHLETLRAAALEHGLRIERVIFAPDLQDDLFETKRGRKLRKRLDWVKKPVWVRHDDHYHVDFAIEEKLPLVSAPVGSRNN